MFPAQGGYLDKLRFRATVFDANFDPVFIFVFAICRHQGSPQFNVLLGRGAGENPCRARTVLVAHKDQIPRGEGARLPFVLPELDGVPLYVQRYPDAATASDRLDEALADFEEGHLVLSVIGTPHVCPAAPVEFPMIADQWFRERGVREDIEITYTYPIQRLHGVRPTAEWMVPRFEERDIQTKTFFNVDNVEDGTIETLEGKELDFDMMIGVPEFTAASIIEEAGLGEEWMEVDRNTLESEHAEDVYGIGDVTNLPTSKAGSVAHYASGTLVSRLSSEVRGQTPTETFHGKTICFIEAGTEEGTFIEFAYDREPVVRDENRFLHWSKLGYNEAYWLTARGVM